MYKTRYPEKIPHTQLSYCSLCCHTAKYLLITTIMDCVSAASDLKKLLVAHSHAENQVSVLGK